jgi:AcrR family transcriptional regulator
MSKKSTAPQPNIILDAAAEHFIQHGIEKTGMKEVAAAAGVARSTLYRYFPSRDDMLIAVIQRDMLDMASAMNRKLQRYPDPADHLVEGLIIAIEEIPKRPLLNAVFAADESSRARRAVWNSKSIVSLGEGFMQDVITPAVEQGLLQETTSPEILIEWVYRIMISFLTLPSNFIRNRKQLRATLHALLIPVILKPQQ